MTAAAAAGTSSRPEAWYVVAVLCVGSVVSMIDRQVINLLVEPMKADLDISDTQISLLQGFAFALFYSIAAVPIGRLADRGNRRNVIIGGVLAFSMATFGCGLATSLLLLFLARTGVGVGEATLTPSGYSLLGDYFCKGQLGRAVSLFSGATFVGSGLALLLIAAMLRELGTLRTIIVPGLGAMAMWRVAFMLSAIPGLLFAALMLTVREPPRSGPGAETTPVPLAEVVRFVSRNAGLYVPLFVGLPLLAAAQFALNAWTPTVFIRQFQWSPSAIGSAFGGLVMVMSPLGMFAGGWLADLLHARGRRDASLIVPLLAALTAAPFALAFPLVDSAWVSLTLLAPALLFGSMPFGAGTAAIPALAPNRMRAQLLACYLLIANLVGGLGPWIVAVASDRLLGGPAHLGTALAIGATAVLLAGAAVIAAGVGWQRAVQRG